jgi:glutamate racemase
VSYKHKAEIGILDSGVGGLSVLRHIQSLLPSEDLIYFADQAHVPYGRRSQEEIRRYSFGISRFLNDEGARIIVVACNAASGAALSYLRRAYPSVPIVGMEPAVKPGASLTKSGRIGVLATTFTFNSQRYSNLMAEYAQGVVTYQDPCHGLVEQIENGQLDSAETEEILNRSLAPMLAGGVDTLVLGCTHYPFVMPLIQQIVGPEVHIIDPAPAVALQLERVMVTKGFLTDNRGPGQLRAFTSGDPELLASVGSKLLGHKLPVTAVSWQDDISLTYFDKIRPSRLIN